MRLLLLTKFDKSDWGVAKEISINVTMRRYGGSRASVYNCMKYDDEED